MTDNMLPWDGRDSIDSNEEAALLSRIPLLAGDSKKADYLCWRASGFPVQQACELAKVKLSTVHKWRRQDAVFAVFESDRLPELQARVGPDLLRLEFMRNFRLLLRTDAEVIRKGFKHLAGYQVSMNEREWQYFRQIRSHYTASDFLNLEKALTPERHADRPVTVVLSFQGAPREDDHQELEAAFNADYREIGPGE